MDRELEGKGQTRGIPGGKGIKTGENRGPGNGEKGNERGGLGKGEGRGLITQVEGEGEGQSKVALY